MPDATFSVETVCLDPRQPQVTALRFLSGRYIDALRRRTIYHQGGVFYTYRECAGYAPYEEASLKAELLAFFSVARLADGSTFGVTTTRMNDVLNALRAICHLPTSRQAPTWLDDTEERSPKDFVLCTNGVLYLPTRALLSPTPQFFSTSGVAFPFQRETLAPIAWLRFLHTLWPEDADAQETLQEWMGYLLTSHTYFQKMLLLVGPARSGKGTIGRVIQRLIGAGRVCAPTLSNLSEQFGINVLIDKSVALVADARLSGRSDTSVIAERLLSISGEDPQTIPRKFLDDWNGPLGVRFMLMSNELPRVEDASGALASRFLVLVLRDSFLGREDHQLFASLVPELPAIFNWALDGWDRLVARGRFHQPASSEAVIQEFQDLGSPIRAYLRERCRVLSGLQMSKEALFEDWQTWCREHGRDHAGTSHVFSRNLRAACPWLTSTRLRVDGKQVDTWQGIGLSQGEDNWVV